MRKDKGLFCRNGVWHIDYRTPAGRRRREIIGPNKELAKAVYAKRKVEMAEGKFLDIVKKDKILFEQFAQRYLNDYAIPNKKGWKTDQLHISHLKGFFKDKCIDEILAVDIEQYKVKRLQDKVPNPYNPESTRTISRSTINRELSTLRSILSKAIEWDLLTVSPFKKIKFFHEPEGRLRFLEREEIVKLLSCCRPNLQPIVILALFAGMRRGEILKLKWTDVDYRRGVITLLNTKNGKKRELPMGQEVKDALLLTRKHPESPYIFCDRQGGSKGGGSIKTAFATALRRAEITGFHFHDLRHTFASQLVMAGVSLNTVRELLGHADINMTLRYSHLAPDHKMDAINAYSRTMDAFWTRPVKNTILQNT